MHTHNLICDAILVNLILSHVRTDAFNIIDLSTGGNFILWQFLFPGRAEQLLKATPSKASQITAVTINRARILRYVYIHVHRNY